MPSNQPRISPYFWVIAATSVALDQFTKRIIEWYIPLGGAWPKSGFFQFTHGENTGSAFGMFQNSRLILSMISSIGVMVVLYIALFLARRFAFLRWPTTILALGLILGGTAGNLIDRAFIGHVTDFLKAGPWPDFNVADSSLVVGGILLAINLIRASSTEGGDAKSTAPQS
jgi:signal peptidase II